MRAAEKIRAPSVRRLEPSRPSAARGLTVLRIVAGVLTSLVLGLGSLEWALRPGIASGEIANGPWRTSVVNGSRYADLYTRARVSVDKLLALSAPESLYYTAATDSEGRPLEARCRYRLEGEDLPARWWSVTSYGPDGFLIANPSSRYSISRANLSLSAEGRWHALVSRDVREGNWLPSAPPGSEGSFTLTLRLYDPERSAIENPRSIPLPRVLRELCP